MTADPTYETIDLPGTAVGLRVCSRCGAFVCEMRRHTEWHRDPSVSVTIPEARRGAVRGRALGVAIVLFAAIGFDLLPGARPLARWGTRTLHALLGGGPHFGRWNGAPVNDDEKARAAAILRDHVEGLHADHDDPVNGCGYKGCEDAYWLLAGLQKDGPVSIEDLLR